MKFYSENLGIFSVQPKVSVVMHERYWMREFKKCSRWLSIQALPFLAAPQEVVMDYRSCLVNLGPMWSVNCIDQLTYKH